MMVDVLSRSTPLARVTRRAAVGLALVLATLPGTAAWSAVGNAPEAETFIETVGSDTIEVLQQAGSTTDQRVDAIQKILNQAADVELIGRLVLGRHWRQATPEQQEQYTRLFRGYALNSLAQRFSNYQGGERFKITGSQAIDEQDSQVGTEIYLPSRSTPIAVDWRVRREDGRFSIIDVVAEGVSMLITNRAQIDSIVNRQGMDGLLQEMRGWAGSLAS